MSDRLGRYMEIALVRVDVRVTLRKELKSRIAALPNDPARGRSRANDTLVLKSHLLLLVLFFQLDVRPETLLFSRHHMVESHVAQAE